MIKKKYGAKTFRRFEISHRLYAEGLNGRIVVSRGGVAKKTYLKIKDDPNFWVLKKEFDAAKST